MSWLEQESTDFIIRTGDGKEYRPLWKPGTKAVEYNISEFEFPEKEGTLVSRGTVKGARYAIELAFQGEDHLDQARAFEESCKDRRPWTVIHPHYGSIRCYTGGLLFDNRSSNVSMVTGTLIETIEEVNPKVTTDPVDKINFDKQTLDETFTEVYANDVKPETADVNTLTANNTTLYNEGKKRIKSTVDFEAFTNLYNKANSEIFRITEPLNNVTLAIAAVQNVIGYPAQIADTVKGRFELLVSQYTLIRTTLSSIFRRNDKKTYENNQGVMIATMAQAAVTNYDYANTNDVLTITETIMDTYNEYVADLDNLQTPNGADENSYIPDQSSMNALNELVNYTISNLLSIAINSKQERFIYCEEDTNLINLTHRFYGLLPDDSTLQQMADTNNIGLNEYLQIRKGRKIVYYV